MAGGGAMGAPMGMGQQGMGPQGMGQQPNFYGGFQSRFSQPNPYGGFMGFARGYQPYQPMSFGWSNPYWRPQPVMPPQVTQQQQGTGIAGTPISSPPAIVQQYQQMQAAQQAQKKTDQETMMEQLRQSSQMDGGV